MESFEVDNVILFVMLILRRKRLQPTEEKRSRNSVYTISYKYGNNISIRSENATLIHEHVL